MLAILSGAEGKDLPEDTVRDLVCVPEQWMQHNPATRFIRFIRKSATVGSATLDCRIHRNTKSEINFRSSGSIKLSF